MSGIPRVRKRDRKHGQHAYTVAGMGFDTKPDIRKYIQKIRDRLSIGQVLESYDHIFMADLFRYHDEWAAKCGPGFQAIVIGPDSYGGKLFRIRRVDGTEIDISAVHCISGRASNISVLRHEVVDQILAARDAIFAGRPWITCPIDNIAVTVREVDVDHVPPHTFAVLAKTWCAEEGIDLEAIKVEEDIGGADRLADRALAGRWWIYHGQWATLRVISRQAHNRLSRSRP